MSGQARIQPPDTTSRRKMKASPDSPARAAEMARRELKKLARPAGEFDARRYFRGTNDLGFYNVGTATVRRLARSIAT